MTAAETRRFSFALVLAAALMGLIAISGEYSRPLEDRMGGAASLFLRFGLIHILLYGARPYLRRWVPVAFYLALQSSLVAALGVVSGNVTVLMGLVLILTVEAVVIAVDRWRPAIIVTGGIALFIGSFLAIRGLAEATSALAVAVVLGLFIYIMNYARRVVGERRIKALLLEVEATHEDLARYADQVGELTRDQERQRLARELHDTLAQGLAGLTLQLEAADSQLAREGVQQARKIIRGAMQHARASLKGARHAIHELRSPLLTFQASLEEEVARFREAAGLPCDVRFDIRWEPPAEVQSEVRMIVREALTNVTRHASAAHVTVDVRAEARAVELRVEDDGLGFDAEMRQEGSGHYGILGIRERVSELGGEVRFRNRASAGTSILVKIGARTG